MAPRPNVSEQRTSQILDAATSVFARRGFHQASMDDVASEAGLSKGTLYLYFKSKESIIDTLLDRLFTLELEDIKALQEADGSVGGRLMALDRGVTEDIRELTPLLPMIYEFYAGAARRESVREVMGDYYRTYREELAVLVRQGVERDEFRPVDVGDVASAIIAIYEGLILLWTAGPGNVEWGRTNRTALRLLIAGLAVEETSSPSAPGGLP